uniref:SFRICE_033436 n=1 Tax=Spodoptera frugiperda TaxID=7108 RepID=A0A2H1X4Q8_SPOFR
MLLDKRSSKIFNMMITNRVQIGTLSIIWCLLDVDFRDTLRLFRAYDKLIRRQKQMNETVTEPLGRRPLPARHDMARYGIPRRAVTRHRGIKIKQHKFIEIRFKLT